MAHLDFVWRNTGAPTLFSAVPQDLRRIVVDCSTVYYVARIYWDNSLLQPRKAMRLVTFCGYLHSTYDRPAAYGLGKCVWYRADKPDRALLHRETGPAYATREHGLMFCNGQMLSESRANLPEYIIDADATCWLTPGSPGWNAFSNINRKYMSLSDLQSYRTVGYGYPDEALIEAAKCSTAAPHISIIVRLGANHASWAMCFDNMSSRGIEEL